MIRFPQSIYITAFLAAVLASYLSLPFWRAFCVRRGVVDDPGHRKIHAEPIPLAGGLAVLTGLVVPLVLAYLVAKLRLAGTEDAIKLSFGFSTRSSELIAIVTGALGMVYLGWLDDEHELRPSTKFVGQVLIAMMVAVSGVRIQVVPYLIFVYPATVLWILTVTNAMNFMDNMNGLCGGLSVVCAACFGFIAATTGMYLVAAIAFLVAGAGLGFLPHNFPRAKAFLGDSGSHLLGFLLAVLAILPNFPADVFPRYWTALIPLLVLAMPLGDLVWVVLL
ncbi:MAG: MraY family glycosyltransferase, partial [Verrucomicrobia bacterium]|nr:MraY family glycosyltransferase [Verrucomicrobiota bacterium]